MRNKIRDILIRIANKIGADEYYDFGEPIVALVTFNNSLVIATKHAVYAQKEVKGKWVRISKLGA